MVSTVLQQASTWRGNGTFRRNSAPSPDGSRREPRRANWTCLGVVRDGVPSGEQHRLLRAAEPARVRRTRMSSTSFP